MPVVSAASSGTVPGNTPNSPSTLGAVSSFTVCCELHAVGRDDLELRSCSAITQAPAFSLAAALTSSMLPTM